LNGRTYVGSSGRQFGSSFAEIGNGLTATGFSAVSGLFRAVLEVSSGAEAVEIDVLSSNATVALFVR
jgi:hypothetical protein